MWTYLSYLAPTLTKIK